MKTALYPLKIHYNRPTCFIFSSLAFILCVLILISFFKADEYIAKAVAFLIFVFCFYKWLIYFIAFFYSKPGIILEADRVVVNSPLQHYELKYTEIISFNDVDFYFQLSHISYIQIHIKDRKRFFNAQNITTKIIFKINDIFHGSYIYLSFLAYKEDLQFFKSALIPLLHHKHRKEQKTE